MNFFKKAKKLKQKLRYWEYLYYVKNEPVVSDEQYDAVLLELQRLEKIYPYLVTDDSSTCRVGGMPQKSFKKIRHKIPMLSLNSVIEESKLIFFDKRIKKNLHSTCDITYCCELKIDGLASSLLYKNGKLVYAATRGDGIIGEDITKTARVIPSIPICLQNYNCVNFNNTFPNILEIRGEVFISKESFLKLNEIKVQKGEKIFSNARNAASGLLRQLNSDVKLTSFLSFYCYGIGYFSGKLDLPDSHWKRLQLCRSWGFPVSEHIFLYSKIDQILAYYSNMKIIRSDLHFNIDGVVIKVNSCLFQNKLGCGSKAPNWAIAYKFPPVIGLTKVRRVAFQVGRTGIITPIAYIDPIVISSVVIRKVNIHNINSVKKLGLMIGDTVRIQRSGDVIPKILDVVMSKRTNYAKSIEFPYLCPECGTKIIARYHTSILRCNAGLSCLAQRKAMFRHFVSRKAMNISGIGSKIIDQLVDKKLISTLSDLFVLKKHELLALNRLSMLSIERLLTAIESSKKVTLARFIYALGIYNVGESIATNLALSYKKFENLVTADFESLSSLEYIGPIIAENIYYFFRDSDNMKNIKKFFEPSIGINLYSII
ncbi:NAD-dependent DNA ligase LigA [Candidatus Blochmannia ocreatus (nom. nud.)]|uniref:DNA ligase n=1 Tax=Candidatus Blochmannia ocreatus (nom. nud.) TaxID=251538 RepID=A0ABY4SW26_9ENTR|nr:NAD-dependent DNA ligase LigA [Candidatus Blochmannia ocreatus]URJ24991.1 NAD-dependent DNA ligase LigA [Candidatus Blochmannia ocreatus]